MNIVCAIVRIALNSADSEPPGDYGKLYIWQNKRCVHKLHSTSRQKSFQATHTSDGTRYFVWDLLDMWVQLRCSSIVRPRKLNSVTLSIASELIASFKVKEFTLHWWEWKSIYFVFFTLRGSLFIVSHSEMLSSSLFIFSDISSIFMSLTEAELLNEQRGLIKFVSSAYNIAL